MTLSEYQALAYRTCSPVTDEVRERFRKCKKLIVNVLMGSHDGPNSIVADDLKKYIFYGRHPKSGIVLSVSQGILYSYYVPPKAQLNDDDQTINAVHALLGIMSELPEIVGVLLGLEPPPEGQDLKTNMAEELGDLHWYTALFATAFGIDADTAGAANIAKLRKRYPDKFTEHDAINRDTAAETIVLKGVMGPNRLG